MDLKEAGSVVKPGRSGTGTTGGNDDSPTMFRGEKGDNAYILYEEKEEGEIEEEEEKEADDNTLNPKRIRSKLLQSEVRSESYYVSR